MLLLPILVFVVLWARVVVWRSSCGAWKVHVGGEVRAVLLGGMAWREEHGVLPPSVGVLFFERRAEVPDFDHWCVRGWEEPVTVAGVLLRDWERGRVSDAEALAAARGVVGPRDGWEQVGYHWYCLRDDAWAGASAESVVAFALSGPVMKPGCMIEIGFADGHVETILSGEQRWEEVEAGLARYGLALPGGLLEYVHARDGGEE